MIIAVSGKGGVGKTVVSAMLIKLLTETDSGDILALDADPDSDLPEALGVKADKTIGEIREDILEKRDTLPPGMLLEDKFQYDIGAATVETEKFDIITMGRSEGPGCYCAINHILRRIIDAWSKNYDFTILDTEAGLEHLSRRTTRDVDLMLVVTDTSKRGVTTAKRIKDLATELDISIKEMYLILNRTDPKSEEKIKRYAEGEGIEIIGTIPEDELIREYDLEGKSLLELASDSKALSALRTITEKLKLVA